MAEEAATTTDAVDESTADSATAAATEATTTEGEAALGDAGKKALDAMKAQRNEAKAEAKAKDEAIASLRAEFESFKAKAEGKEAEHQAALDTQRVKDEALAAANERIKKAEVRAAAAGKLNDPKDALSFIDLSTLEVSVDGEVDGDAVAAAINDLITNKPYLAAQGKRFEGTADGGTRKADEPKNIDQQIAEAEKAGDWAMAAQLKVKKLTEPTP